MDRIADRQSWTVGDSRRRFFGGVEQARIGLERERLAERAGWLPTCTMQRRAT